MNFTIFETEFGYSGIAYWTKGNAAKAVEVFYPRSKKAVGKAMLGRFPHALESPGDEVSELRSSIQDFFLGKPESIPLSLVDTSICTPFQLSVLRDEHAIPRGQTSSYGRFAERLESRATRAVGSALARNPFPFVVPCHRAVRSDRTIGMYQGGPELKRRILSMEGVDFDSSGRVHPDHFLG
ncbi:MAG: methylated-DNA--[protein]-cysteine S-methyltransferase [Candidatus Thorarchaeota archaeon]